MMYEVRRSFPSARPVRVGQIVDASGWRNRRLLERQGYIAPVDAKKARQTEPEVEEIIFEEEEIEIATEPEAEEIVFEEEEIEIATEPEKKPVKKKK